MWVGSLHDPLVLDVVLPRLVAALPVALVEQDGGLSLVRSDVPADPLPVSRPNILIIIKN